MLLQRPERVHNPFQKPHSVEQWLLGSICWSTSCYVMWWLFTECLSPKQVGTQLADGVGMAAFWLAHLLVWRYAVNGGEEFTRSPIAQTTALEAVASLWLALLWLFQVVTLLLGILATLFVLLFPES